ncbi:MAG: superoxide dismutase [Holosporales bacterium]|jgi:Fe-Mn family superoxide dismutase|nr:superoxide dismutase [Holosporales bacterium]
MIFNAQIPYDNDHLVPILSAETLKYHYGKHHVGYAQTLQTLVAGTDLADISLNMIIARSEGNNEKIYNTGLQLFNHDFYWKCLSVSEHRPTGKLNDLILSQFKTFERFLNEYIDSANSVFGSGWSWLTWQRGRILFMNTQNAEVPIVEKLLCVIDLWEHAYYIDYRNDRSAYINNIITKCINWEYCESLMPWFV